VASITIRNLDESLKSKLRVAAARHGRSMEDEVRHILRESLSVQKRKSANLFDSIRRRMEPIGGGVELDIARRGQLREPPSFEE